MSGATLKALGHPARLRAYAFGLVSAALVAAFAIAESLTERYVSDHSRLAGTAIELAIVAIGAVAFRPVHHRVESLIEAAFTKRRREAREALSRLKNELTSFVESKQMLHSVISAVDKHMGARGCAIYLHYGAYVPDVSSFDSPLDSVEADDPLVLQFTSSPAAADPRALGSAVPGDLAFPMIAGGELVGFLTLNLTRAEFEPEDRIALAALAEATGLALVVHDPLGTLPSTLSIVDSQELYAVPGFSGREEELAAIAEALAGETTTAAVVGMGGVGKSSVAREYAWRHRDRYSVMWWLNAQTEDGIIEGLQRLGAMFVHGLEQLADRRAAAQRVINSILSGFDKPVLLIFDNLEDERLVRTWMPRSGARALVTSRDAAWGSAITAILLQTWPLDTAVDYLLSASGRTDLGQEMACAIAQSLGALPLALSHAAAVMRNLQMVSPERYLEHISEHLSKAPRGAEYPRSVFATFSTAIAQAEQQAPGAAAVLCFAASFAPDAIPDELFRQEIVRYAEELQPVLPDGTALKLHSAIADELRLDEALGALDRLSLLTFAKNSRSYSVHRLVQLAAQDLVAGSVPGWRECAVVVADAAFLDPEDVATWPQCERLLPHARVALDALPDDTNLLPAAGLAYRCARYVWLRGEYGAAELLSNRALAIRERALGPDHLDVAACLHLLAVVYWDQGRYDEAESVNSRVLAIREWALGPDHPDVAVSLNNLAGVYRNQGRYEESERMHMRALAIWEKTHGPDHPGVAAMLDNVANIYHYQGHYEKAKELRTRALTIREKALGHDHHLVAGSLSNLATEYLDQGRYAQAEPLITRALAIQEKAFGPHHRLIAGTLNNLAMALRPQGRLDEAEGLLRRSLAIYEKALGSEHDQVAESLLYLVDMYCEQHRYDEAEPLSARAAAISEKALGPDHSMVARSLNLLANVHRGQGRYADAESLYRRALGIFGKAVSPDHPDVAQNLDDLAVLYRQQRRFDETMPLLVRALAIRENAFGPDHPSTQATRHALDTLGSQN